MSQYLAQVALSSFTTELEKLANALTNRLVISGLAALPGAAVGAAVAPKGDRGKGAASGALLGGLGIHATAPIIRPLARKIPNTAKGDSKLLRLGLATFGATGAAGGTASGLAWRHKRNKSNKREAL